MLCAMAVCSLSVKAYEIIPIDGITYYLNTGTKVAYVMCKNGAYGNNPSNWYEGDIVINSSVTYEGQKYTVKGIDSNAFEGCVNLTSVTLPNTVDSIGSLSFDHCTSLVSVNIPNGVRTIHYWTFRNCTSLREITIPASVESIRWSAFEGCEFDRFIVKSQKVLAQTGDSFSGAIADAKIHHFIFGGDVHTIPTNVLADYNYTSSLYNIPARYKVTLEDAVTALDVRAFANCPRLKSLVLSKNLTTIGSFSLNEKLDTLTIQNQTTIDAFHYLMQSGVDSLAHLVLKGSTITSIPAGFASGATTLETVRFPQSLETINDAAFMKCTALREVKFPNGANALKTIGNNVFEETAIQTFSGSSALETIGDGAFKNCKQLVSVSDLNSLKTIGSNAFYYCVMLEGLYSLYDLTSLGESAFEGCLNLKSISLYSVPEIQAKTFYGCKALENVNIGIASTFGNDAFYYCKAIAYFTAGSDNTVYASEGGVLYNKSKTELVRFPPAKTAYTFLSSVTSISKKAFEYCKGACAITSMKETPPAITEGNNLFGYADGTVDVYVPEAAMEAYMTAWGGSQVNYHALQNGTCTVDGITYEYQSDGTAKVIASSPKYSGNIVIPETFTYNSKTYRVTELGYDAFSQCTELTSVSLPNSLEKISLSFNNCTGLTSITIPENVYSINSYAFMQCSNLQTIYCKPYRSVPSIGGTSFDLLAEDILIYVPASLLDDYKARWSGMTNIQAFIDNCAGVNTAAVTSKVILSKPVSVAFVSGKYVYIQDETATTLLYLNAADDAIYAGAKIAGVEGYVTIYGGLPELIPTNDVSDWTITPDGEEPYSTTLTEVPTDDDMNQLVKIENVSIEAEFTTSRAAEVSLILSDGEIILRNQFRLAQSFSAEKRYDILAAVATNNDTKKLYFIEVINEYDVPTGTDNVESDKIQSTKVLRNGQIYILRGEKVYTLQGLEVR